MCLSENICRLINRRNRNKMNKTTMHVKAYEMTIYFNMLRAFMENIIMCYLDSTSVITINGRSTILTDSHIFQ